jgi:threonine/homoserine/homoserine lactone efflux protein
MVWALLSVAWVSALVAASELAFAALKIVGAAVLIWLGVQSLLSARRGDSPPRPAERSPRTRRRRQPPEIELRTTIAVAAPGVIVTSAAIGMNAHSMRRRLACPAGPRLGSRWARR